MKVAVIGGGAAGFFSAIHVKVNYPNSNVTLFDKSKKLLAKVKISGGGRCNVTNGCNSISELSKAYPRGGKKLKKAFNLFSTKDTIKWFENRNTPLYTQQDNRVFPKSDSSKSIVNCLLNETKRLGIDIKIQNGVIAISPRFNNLEIAFYNGNKESFTHVIVATGGSPKINGLNWLAELGHSIIPPVPSLFTFNIPKNNISSLMGVSVKNAIVKIQSTKLNSSGPILITHWGMSGPAVLKLSSIGARILNQFNYNFKIQINWTNLSNNQLILDQLQSTISKHPQKKVSSTKLFNLPASLWVHLLSKSNIMVNTKWSELSKKSTNKLLDTLANDIYQVKGKTTFKEEFVTCGGVSLDSINFNTMESKYIKNLFFAGEVLDIDAITGGYNFQAAWTTGFIAGKLGGNC